MKLLTLVVCLDAVAFLVYGILCIGSLSLVSDFERYGVANLRILTGALEVLGGSGLLIGLRWRPALSISAGGLFLLMLIAFGFRVRFRDSVAASLPSVMLSVLNFFLMVRYWEA